MHLHDISMGIFQFQWEFAHGDTRPRVHLGIVNRDGQFQPIMVHAMEFFDDA
jgi:hypothetical protein